MSKTYDKAMEVLDVGHQTPAGGHYGGSLHWTEDGKCWRCRKHPSRVEGTDFTCEGCWAYLTEQTDDDPRTAPTRNKLDTELAVPLVFMGTWGIPQYRPQEYPTSEDLRLPEGVD